MKENNHEKLLILFEEKEEEEEGFSIKREIEKLKKNKEKTQSRFFWKETSDFAEFFTNIWMKIKSECGPTSPYAIADIAMKSDEYKNSLRKPTKKQMVERVRTLNRRDLWKGDKNGRVKKGIIKKENDQKSIKALDVNHENFSSSEEEFKVKKQKREDI